MFGPSGVLPMVLPFTQFYPITQGKLGKTVLRFYPPTLCISLTIFNKAVFVGGQGGSTPIRNGRPYHT